MFSIMIHFEIKLAKREIMSARVLSKSLRPDTRLYSKERLAVLLTVALSRRMGKLVLMPQWHTDKRFYRAKIRVLGVLGLTDWSLTTYAVNFPLVECFPTGVTLSDFNKIVVG